MKKYIIRVAVFVCVFCILFSLAQSVLHYRWYNSESLYTKNIEYSRAKSNSIDIICFGTSEILADYKPIIAYDECGITGYNFAISSRSAVTVYYQVLYALKYQTPKILICDFACMFDDCLPSDIEKLYRKVVECMPDKKLKMKLIHEICTIDKSQSYLSWVFPIFRYHTMWSELSAENFRRDLVYNEDYPKWLKGTECITDSFHDELYEITPERWTYSENESEFSKVSIHYYDLIIELCREKGIQVVAVLPPKISAASSYAARWCAMKEYFDQNGVKYLNYNTYEQVQRMGLTFENDYYDAAHCNLNGGVKFTRVLARDLKEMFDLDDHKVDPYYEDEWNEALLLFYKEHPDQHVNK